VDHPLPLTAHLPVTPARGAEDLVPALLKLSAGAA